MASTLKHLGKRSLLRSIAPTVSTFRAASSVVLPGTRYTPDGGTYSSLHQGQEALRCEVNEPPFVLLHGLFGSQTNFRSIARSLAQATRREVLCFDLRNHGEAPWSTTMTYDAMALDVIEALSNACVGASSKPILVGHSMGGKVAMVAALRYPEVVGRLCVVDIAPVKYPTMRQARGVAQAMRQVPLTGTRAIYSRGEADQYLRRLVQDDTIRRFALTNFIPGQYSNEGTRSASWRVNLDAVLQAMGSLSDFPRMSPKVTFAQRTLVIYGLKSDYVVDAQRSNIAALFPKVQLQGFETGHWVHAEKPKEFVTALCQLASE